MSNSEGDLSTEQVFGRVMREVREEARRSQQWLAERMTSLGFSWRQSTVAKVEAGERTVTLNEHVAVGDIFDVEMLELIRDWRVRGMYQAEAVREAEARVAEVQHRREEARATLFELEDELSRATARLRTIRFYANSEGGTAGVPD